MLLEYEIRKRGWESRKADWGIGGAKFLREKNKSFRLTQMFCWHQSHKNVTGSRQLHQGDLRVRAICELTSHLNLHQN